MSRRQRRVGPTLVTCVFVSVILAGCFGPTGGEGTPAAVVSPGADGLRGLPPEVVEGLRSGAGLGYANAAERNGHPGPLHVLELADRLELSADQEEEARAIRARMLLAAVPLGEAMVEVQRTLEDGFRGDRLTDAVLRELVERYATLEGRLRLVHLGAHLEMSAVLSEHQRHAYAAIRHGEDAHGGSAHGGAQGGHG